MEKSSSRLKVLALLVAVMFAALSTRLWFLQVLAVAQNREKATQNSIRIVESDALRGNIVTADGKMLVTNRGSLEVRANKTVLEASPHADAVLLRLSNLLDIPVQTIRERLDSVQFSDLQPKPIAEFVSEDIDFVISEHPNRYPGISVVPTSVRDYPQGRMAAHIVGYLGQINAQEVADPRFKHYGLSDLVGRAGLEATYERYLRGTKGKQKLIVNSDGEVIRALGSIPAKPGDTLHLTLDSEIQKAVQQELYTGIQQARGQIDEAGGRGLYLRATSGAAVVMDVETGGIVAMASWPTFDPSWYVKGLTDRQYHYLNENQQQMPALNRAFMLTYKPGSTFKPFVALAATKEHIAGTNQPIATLGGYYECPAEYVVPGDETGTTFTNWSSTTLGYMSIAQSLKVSCDTVYYSFGEKFWRIWQADPFGVNNEPLQRDLKQWTFGRPTGIDLPAETTGVIPDAKFADDNPTAYPDGPIPGIDILLSIGSGDTLSTPLQMVTAYSALANGGHVCRPHVVDHITDAQNRLVKTVSGHCNDQLPYSAPELSYIRSALATVTQVGGTAASAFSGFPVNVAGKTGTAERDNSGEFQSTSWFSSFAPAENPKYAVVVMVEQGGYGSQTAAPIARHIYEHLFGITPTGEILGGAQD